MKQNSNSSRQGGFSLIMIMVAVGLIAVISAGLTSMLSNAFTTQKIIQNRQAALSIQLYALGLLSNPEVCRATFQNVNVTTGLRTTPTTAPINPVGVQTQIWNGTVAFLQANQTYEQGSILLRSFGFDNSATYGWKPYMAGPPNMYKGTITLLLRMEGQGVPANSNNMLRTIQLSVITKGYAPVPGNPNEIESCISVGNGDDDIWRYSANSLDIYYGTTSGSTSVAKVGIGTDTPVRELDVRGSILADGFFYASDARMKTNYTPLQGMDGIGRLHGINFNWKKDGTPSFGLLAQEVEKVYPLAVWTDPKTDSKMVNYSQLVAPLINAVNELHQENKALKSRIEKLELEVAKPDRP